MNMYLNSGTPPIIRWISSNCLSPSLLFTEMSNCWPPLLENTLMIGTFPLLKSKRVNLGSSLRRLLTALSTYIYSRSVRIVTSTSPSGNYRPEADEPNCLISQSGTTSYMTVFSLLRQRITQEKPAFVRLAMLVLLLCMRRIQWFHYESEGVGLGCPLSSWPSKDMLFAWFGHCSIEWRMFSLPWRW